VLTQIRLRGTVNALGGSDREKLHDIKLLKTHFMIWRVSCADVEFPSFSSRSCGVHRYLHSNFHGCTSQYGSETCWSLTFEEFSRGVKCLDFVPPVIIQVLPFSNLIA